MGLRNISNRMAGLLSSIFHIGEAICYFPTRVSKIIVSFMHFWKNTILRSNIKRFSKRPRNETDESEELIVLVARKCVHA